MPFLKAFAAAFFLISASPLLYAQQVQEIEAGGSLKTDDGKQYVLAGIRLPEESLPLVSLLLAGKTITSEKDSKAAPDHAGTETVYLYVDAKEILFPFKTSAARNSKILVNRFLVEIGAASVLESDFEKRPDFLAVQETARDKGEGIWSYDTAETPK